MVAVLAAEALVAAAAADAGVVDVVFAALTVRDDVVYLGTVAESADLIVQPYAAFRAMLHAVALGSADCLCSDLLPDCCSCA